MITIKLPVGDKCQIALDTYHAIKRALPIYADDWRVIRYASAPHERIEPEVVAAIRRKMIRRGELSARAFSRRSEEKAAPGRSWRASLADAKNGA
jgi:hypothetical protein